MDIKNNLQTEKLKDIGLKVLATIGFVAILAAGAWGSFQVIRNAPNIGESLTAAVANLTSRFFPAEMPDKEVVLTGPVKLLTSGEPFTLTWESNALSNTYELGYSCSDGFRFETETGETIPCDEPFPFVDTDNMLSLTAFSEKHHFFDVVVTLATIPEEDGEQIEGSLLLTVVNKETNGDLEAARNAVLNPPVSAGTPRKKTTATSVQVPAPTTVNPTGLPDLSVRILESGIIDRETDLFVATSTIKRGQLAAVRFEVSNIGTNVSGVWKFTAKLPTTSMFIYKPVEQQSLNPGDRIEYTISFDRITHASEGLLSIDIDPDGRLNEITRVNNHAEIVLQVLR